MGLFVLLMIIISTCVLLCVLMYLLIKYIIINKYIGVKTQKLIFISAPPVPFPAAPAPFCSICQGAYKN